jgi:hypothetical protein
MTGALTAALLLGAAAVSLWRFPPLHPAQLWTLPWAAAVTLYALHLLPYRELSWGTAALVIGATGAVVLASALGGRRRTGTARVFPDVGRLGSAALVAAAGTGLLLGLFLAQAATQYGLRAALVSSPEVRLAIGEGAFALTIKYVYPALATVLLAGLAAGREPDVRRRRWWLLLAGAATASVYFSTGRATILTAVVVGAVAFAIARDQAIPLRRYLLAGGAVAAVALTVFLAGGALIGKTLEAQPDLQRIPSFFSKHSAWAELALPYQYASAPIAALDVVVRDAGALGGSDGCASAPEACRVLNRLGIGVEPVERIRPFTPRPLPWNTYTALEAPILDFGLALVIPVLFAIGYLVGLAWAFARAGSLAGLVAYPLLASALLSSYGTFDFTAPHLIGAAVIALVAMQVAPWAASVAASIRGVRWPVFRPDR